MNKFFACLCLMAGVVVSSVASAAVINGRIHNIDGDGDGAIDDVKVSRVMFTVSAGSRIFFDSLVLESTGVDLNGDGFITGFDNQMMLLTSDGAYITNNDDSSNTAADGSVHGFDSTLDWTFGEAGTYLVTLGQLSYDVASAFKGYDDNELYINAYDISDLQIPNGDASFGAWRLTMTVLNGTLSNVSEIGAAPIDVPEPASLALFGAGLACLAARRRKARLLS